MNGEEVKALLEKANEGMIKIKYNGKVLFVKEMLKDDMPKLDFSQDRTVKCMNGYHSIGTKCVDCEYVDSCSQWRKERIEGIGKR